MFCFIFLLDTALALWQVPVPSGLRGPELPHHQRPLQGAQMQEWGLLCAQCHQLHLPLSCPLHRYLEWSLAIPK